MCGRPLKALAFVILAPIIVVLIIVAILNDIAVGYLVAVIKGVFSHSDAVVLE